MWNKVFRMWWRVAFQSRKRDKTQGAEAKRAARRKDGGGQMKGRNKLKGWSPQNEEDARKRNSWKKSYEETSA
jgi:hypothetical protein